VLRFSELARRLPQVSDRILTRQLRELEGDGLVLRRVFAQVPPRVEYELTPDGLSLIPVLEAMSYWGSRRGAPATGLSSGLKNGLAA